MGPQTPQHLNLESPHPYIYITQHLLPPLQDQHASYQEMSYSKREVKLKKEEKKRNKPYHLYTLSCRIVHRQISTYRLHITVTTNNCGILSRSGAHPQGYASYTCHPPPTSYYILPHFYTCFI